MTTRKSLKEREQERDMLLEEAKKKLEAKTCQQLKRYIKSAGYKSAQKEKEPEVTV